MCHVPPITVNVLALMKDRERYVFLFDRASEAELLRSVLL